MIRPLDLATPVKLNIELEASAGTVKGDLPACVQCGCIWTLRRTGHASPRYNGEILHR